MADEMIIADSDGLPLTSKKKYSKNDLERFYRINKTIHEMLHDRGYLIFTEDLQQTFKSFKQNFTSIETHHIHATHSTDPKKSILVIFDHFPGNKKMILTDRSLGEMSRRHNDIYENCKHKIVVSNRQIGPKAKKMCGHNKNDGSSLEYFAEEELMINITDHSMVGIFEILDDEEKEEMLERYRINESHLPRMEKSDMISRYYNAKQGDVFKVIRKSEIAGRYLYYRIVQ